MTTCLKRPLILNSPIYPPCSQGWLLKPDFIVGIITKRQAEITETNYKTVFCHKPTEFGILSTIFSYCQMEQMISCIYYWKKMN